MATQPIQQAAMHLSPTFRLTHSLRGANAAEAVGQLHGTTETAAVDGLVELIYLSSSSTLIVSAIEALSEAASEIVLDALGHALDSAFPLVRAAAISALQRRRCHRFDVSIGRILRSDGHWTVRRTALEALGDSPEPEFWSILAGVTDPHWRVRHALIQTLLRRGDKYEHRELIASKLEKLPQSPRFHGIREYLGFRWEGVHLERSLDENVDRFLSCPFWDPDSAVLFRSMKTLAQENPALVLDHVSTVLAEGDDKAARLVCDLLHECGKPAQIMSAVDQLDEPRLGTGQEIARLLSRLDHDRIEAVARLIFDREDNSPASLGWAIDQVEVVFPYAELKLTIDEVLQNSSRQPPIVRAALARLLGRLERSVEGLLVDAESEVRLAAARCWKPHLPRIRSEILERLATDADPRIRAEAAPAAIENGAESLLESLASDTDAHVRLRLAECLARQIGFSEVRDRLQADRHPLVRAAALTNERAAELIQFPDREASWHVLAQAARLCKLPIWKLDPEQPWQPRKSDTIPAETLDVRLSVSRRAKPLSVDGPSIAPMAISGHYGLPIEGFIRAVEAGVNLLFWEPNYRTLNEFAARLSPMHRRQLLFLAGTFEAEPDRIVKDVDRVLRSLRIERVSIFQLFWVQNWLRVTPEVREVLEKLQKAGKIERFGLSTHSRPLAIEAIETGWNPVMIRHSAAHRGAEEKVFPAALRRGTSILTFNNTCYGRLLKGVESPDAADCYRYSLEQPGVTACIAAPATLQQLDQNLLALHEPELPSVGRERLRRQGEMVYREDIVFRKLIRER
jgi:hypothetical protein